ncbi:hypothetical protein [Celeribacter marinus]|uniref:hypothetical protein n=1 Tax=Celeribacter marinus TaxID=1397108 RepID=UPI000783571A|nr:hypothetical protein [Celeribacter marinus]SFK04348.1 hypothetical protein SAMN05444421_101208 [Celeribacter marinus]
MYTSVPDIEPEHVDHYQRNPTDCTKGFRRFRDIKLDDLTHKVFEHFCGLGHEQFFLDEVLSVGDNILQSPLERAIFALLRISDFQLDIKPHQIFVVLPGENLPSQATENDFIAIYPQCGIAGYHLDFGIFVQIGDMKLKIDLECDGVDFHDRSESQTSKDFRRNIALSGKGFKIYRMLGCDINRNPLHEVDKLTTYISEVIFLESELRH